VRRETRASGLREIRVLVFRATLASDRRATPDIRETRVSVRMETPAHRGIRALGHREIRELVPKGIRALVNRGIPASDHRAILAARATQAWVHKETPEFREIQAPPPLWQATPESRGTRGSDRKGTRGHRETRASGLRETPAVKETPGRTPL
jgi:hypothetical protein